MQMKVDEWTSLGAPSGSMQSDVKDAFASPPLVTPAPADQHVNKMANIMASFGTGSQQQQQTQGQHGANAFQQGMATPAASMMGMPMNGRGMMQLRPAGMCLPMNTMAMNGQGFMPSNMMGYPMQNQMLGFPQQAGMMMGTEGRWDKVMLRSGVFMCVCGFSCVMMQVVQRQWDSKVNKYQ